MGAALRMLSRRALSEGEIRDKLSDRGFASAQAEAAIRRLRELGLVDDRKLCAQLARSYRESRRYGPVKISWTLRARRFPPDLVEEVLKGSSSEEDEVAAAMAALRKKFRGEIPSGRQGAAKAYRFLAMRGFLPETCRRAIGGPGRDIQEGED
ncbi:MAG: regulatory protein RecX [Deltaproteobacteria bacterium]|nr:regulatory protein RecX [Deltaproteobacteria bacterium]